MGDEVALKIFPMPESFAAKCIIITNCVTRVRLDTLLNVCRFVSATSILN
jgi:hypothetical protein